MGISVDDISSNDHPHPQDSCLNKRSRPLTLHSIFTISSQKSSLLNLLKENKKQHRIIYAVSVNDGPLF